MPDPAPYENPAIVEAYRATYDEHVKRAVLQFDIHRIPSQVPTDPTETPEKLTLIMNEARVADLIEDLELMRRFFSN